MTRTTRLSAPVLLFVLLLCIAGPVKVLANSQQAEPQDQKNSTTSENPVVVSAARPFDRPPMAPATSEEVIRKAEDLYRQGEQARSRGEIEAARKRFDEAVDAVMDSGISLRSDSRLDAFYRDLLQRIHSHSEGKSAQPQTESVPAVPQQQQPKEVRPEVLEPAVVDQLNEVNESELAVVSPEGIRIYGRYDFPFSVAPPVYQYLNYFVTGRGRSTMEIGLQRSGRYRQMAEKIFKEERVPEDLIWLAQAESVWKPNALSRAAAKGIWQFIPSTGTRFGLAQTGWVDQRSNPEASTRAAARYLRWLHDYFAGDWMLAMAAYNSGENRVAGAIAKCGYADFWELHRRNLLPAETRNYVPIILSIVIVSKNQKRYGFNVRPDLPVNYDTYELPDQTDLKVVADLLGVPYEAIQDLNPELRRGASPPQQRYTVKIPKGMKKQFEIAYASLPEDQRVRKIVIPREEIAEDRPAYRTQLASYQVRKGDTLSSVARRSGVSVPELARINRLSARGELKKGQTIKVPRSAKSSVAKKGSKGSRYQSRSASKSKARKANSTKSKAKSSKRSRR